ncbi:MAG: hypothetical protein ACI9DF_001350, partial [Verrucomicrobiales bacterium]
YAKRNHTVEIAFGITSKQSWDFEGSCYEGWKK